MPLVPLAEAARRLGKPERTVRRWAAQGKVRAERQADGWHVEVSEADASHSDSGLSTIPTTYLVELMHKAEAAAYHQGRAEVLEAQVARLEAQLALPPPPAQPPRHPWWRFWTKNGSHRVLSFAIPQSIVDQLT